MTISPLRLRPSRYLAVILLLIGLGGVISVWFLPLFWGAQSLLSLGIIGITWDAIGKYALLKSPDAWRGLRLNSQQQILLFNQHHERAIRLHADSVVTLHFVLLRFQFIHSPKSKWSSSWRHLIILPDACDADVFREWRVWLLWGIAQEQIVIED